MKIINSFIVNATVSSYAILHETADGKYYLQMHRVIEISAEQALVMIKQINGL